MALCQLSIGQSTSQSTSLTCGTINLTPAQATSLVQEANQALQRKRAANATFTAITYVPIRPHIVRRSDGTGGLDLAGLNQMLAYTNNHYIVNGFGIQFYFAGSSPDYIDNDGLYASFPYGEGSVVDANDAHNAMNQYYVYQFSEFIGGYAYFPANYIASTRSFIATGDGSQPYLLGHQTIPHELGHNFSLYHTFGMGIGALQTDELVTRGIGANCNDAGDLVCDTPADPFTTDNNHTITVNGCTQYDPNSPARDVNGDPYAPLVTNIMSYYFGTCAHDFTAGQYDRMQAALALRQSHTAYTLDAPATDVNPPTNLAVSQNGLSITLTWQDNATNEMGYFIERSTSPTTGFLPIYGVAPNVTTFTDTQLTLGTRYYYRIRPSNTTTGNLSSAVSVSLCPTPTYPSSSPARITASLHWTGNTGQTNIVRWRLAGDSHWTTVDNIPTDPYYSTTYSLTGLTSITAYEWQVQGVCSSTVNSDFTDVQSFTTLACQPPVSFFPTNVGSGSVQFFWYTYLQEPNELADIRYRILGTPTWTSISSLSTSSAGSGTSYTLTTGLANNTTYECQIRNVCSTTENSDFTSSATFTTSCRIPTALSTIPTATQAVLGWSISSSPDVGATFDVNYRLVGSSGWTTVSNIAGGTGSSKTYLLTGLTTNAQYEWQVRTACSANAQSDYSGIKQFTTTCNPIFSENSLFAAFKTSTSVQLHWASTNDIGTTHDIRYRPVGNADWITISGTNTTSFGGTYDLTGLANNTTYEWQVRPVCSLNQSFDFTAGPNFTTQCQTPIFLSVFPIMVTSATVRWNQVGIDVTYDIRYRIVGTTDWSTISSISSTSLTITRLRGNSNYEWQVRTICHDGSTTDFSLTYTFFTSPCYSPNGLETTNITVSSARLNWYFYDTDSHFEIRYRVVGTPDWTVVSNLQSSTTTNSFTLTALSSATPYEWQIRTICSGTESSDFTGSASFQTLTSCPDMYTIKAGLWNDPAVWSCNRVPANNDAIQIKHLVIIPASYVATAQRVAFDTGQTISYGTSAQLKLGL